MEKKKYNSIDEVFTCLKRTPHFYNVVGIAYKDEKLIKTLHNIAMQCVKEDKMAAIIIFENEIMQRDKFIKAINDFLVDNDIEFTRWEDREFRWEMANFTKVMIQDALNKIWDAITLQLG